MRKGEATKARMVGAMAELLQRQGYLGTGLSEVVERSEAPKGSLYFHFPGGKEELALQAVNAAGAAIATTIERVLARAPDTAAGFVALADLLAEGLRASGYERGCPLAAVALETAHSSDALAAATAAGFASWEAHIERGLRADGHPPRQAAERAALALGALEGALLLARANRDPGPMKTVARQLAPLLRKDP
jgi:TetR/AcrR family transcriptional repressor of lmrAB and yxaGH operons